MKFQIGDTVKVIANEKRLRDIGIYNHKIVGFRGDVISFREVDKTYYVYLSEANGFWYFAEQDLELVEHKSGVTGQPKAPPQIRKFDTGAKRDSLDGKPSYMRALCPNVLRRYVKYLSDHRTMPDSSLRDFDNWKKGMGKEVYMDGLARHFWSVWLLHQGFPAEDNHGPVTLQDSLCGVLFNAIGYLYELLKEKVCGKTG